jgi:hypothetical protein
MEQRGGGDDINRGKPKYSGETCPSATLYTTIPTRTALGSYPGLRGEKQTNNLLSFGSVDSAGIVMCNGSSLPAPDERDNDRWICGIGEMMIHREKLKSVI